MTQQLFVLLFDRPNVENLNVEPPLEALRRLIASADAKCSQYGNFAVKACTKQTDLEMLVRLLRIALVSFEGDANRVLLCTRC